MRTLPAALAALCGWVCAGSPKRTVSIDLAATWSDDSERSVVLALEYRTSRPNDPYFNPRSQDGRQITAYALSADRKVRRKLGSWANESGDGGGLLNKPFYWLRKRGRLVFEQSQSIYLYDLSAGKRLELRPPQSELVRLAGKSLAERAFGRCPVPSPDGRWVAALFTVTYLEGGPLQPQRFVHWISFFDTSTGKHQRSVKIPWPVDTTDPHLFPTPRDIPYLYRFLWQKDSRGVFAIDSKSAFVIPSPSTPGSTARRVARVPAATVPTGAGGPVSRQGVHIFVRTDPANPNRTTVEQKTVGGWVPFKRVGTMGRGRVRYAVP